MAFWKADRKTSAKIIELVEQAKRAERAADKFSRSLGATHPVYIVSIFGDWGLVGFVFDDPEKVDREKFCKTRRGWKCWSVRRTKKNAELLKQVESHHFGHAAQVSELIGLKQWRGDGKVEIPGVSVVGKTAYIEADARKLHGCVRITDLQFERAMKRKTASGKKSASGKRKSLAAKD
jgi:hypothetical protein